MGKINNTNPLRPAGYLAVQAFDVWTYVTRVLVGFFTFAGTIGSGWREMVG